MNDMTLFLAWLIAVTYNVEPFLWHQVLIRVKYSQQHGANPNRSSLQIYEGSVWVLEQRNAKFRMTLWNEPNLGHQLVIWAPHSQLKCLWSLTLTDFLCHFLSNIDTWVVGRAHSHAINFVKNMFSNQLM